MRKLRNGEVLSRGAFLKLGLAGLSATTLLFLSGCLGGQEKDNDDEDDDDED